MTNVLSEITFGDLGWLPLTAMLAALTVAAIFIAYRNIRHAGSSRFIAASLKGLGLLVLAVCLVEPLWSGMRARPGANLFFIMADNSRSMQIRDVAGSTTGTVLSKLTGVNAKKSRADVVRDSLKTPEDSEKKTVWPNRLAQDFDLRMFSFDSGMQQFDDIADLSFNGDSSALKRHLDSIAETYDERPIGGVLLFTDGNATDIDVAELDTSKWPRIYPVIVGSDEVDRDIAIDNVGVSQTNFEDAPVTVQADVSSSGFLGQVLVARVVDENGVVVERSAMTVQDEDKPLAFRFQMKPKEVGVSFYRLEVASEDDIEALSDGEKSKSIKESTLANNKRLIDLKRPVKPHRILYVSGRPNWEYKFLRRAIEDDEQIDLVGMIRVAKREAKFDFRGRDGESKNSLFRGFEKQEDETAESYDEPVIVRLNTKSPSELRDGFPKAEKDLYDFEAIVMDDIEAKFFTHDQLALIERFVSERGGGLLMLGGQESFQRGGYHRTPIGDLLPVYLDRSSATAQPPRVRLKLTRHGWLQPWVRLRSNEGDEQSRIAEMPEFWTMNRMPNIKPGAWILATAEDESQTSYPALIAQRFGHGRAAALAIGDLWRWQLRRDEEENDHAKSWRQTLRWLVADVPKRIDVEVEDDLETSDAAIRFKVRLKDEEFKPLENATVKVRIGKPKPLDELAKLSDEAEAESAESAVEPIKADVEETAEDDANESSEQLELPLEASLTEPGTYEVVYVPRESGAYRASFAVIDSDGEPVGTAKAGWTSDPGSAEFRSIAANRKLLDKIAEKTEGRVLTASELPKFVAGLSTEEMPISERWTFPIWDHPAVFLLAIGCFIAEWGLRRWKGLP